MLIVESHLRRASMLRKALRGHGVLADVAMSGEDALWMAASTRYDVITLDLALPGIDGFETCRRLRADGVRTPIAMMSGRDVVADRIAGLDAGADDFFTRPFQFAEILARLRALARRAPHERPAVLRVGDLEFDLGRCAVRREGREIALTRKERALLEILMRHPGQAVSRHRLLDGAWESAVEQRSNVLEACVRCLRKKIDCRGGVSTIETIRGVGYRLNIG